MVEVSLTIHSPNGTIQVPLTKDRLTIGRSEDADLYIDDSGLSRLHASINRDGDRVWIIDEGSTNGSFVNAKPVPAVGRPLSDKDKINIGDYTTIWVNITRPNPHQLNDSHQGDKLPDHTQNSSSPNFPFVVGIILVFGLVGTLGWLVLKTALKGDDGRSSANQNTSVGGEATNKNSSPDPPPQTSSVNVPLLANKLAFAILQKEFDSSEKDRYVFDTAFVERINRYTSEYRDVIRDESRCFDIAQAFNHQGMHPLLGLVMAMSESKFKESEESANAPPRRIGLLRVPMQIAEVYRSPGESLSDLNKRSAQIAAVYMKSLVDYFKINNFVYAIACFGMKLNKVAIIQRQLEQLNPATRRDFWKVVNSGAVSLPSEAIDRVARFFAAGIVGEYPQMFYLNAKPLSSLY